MRIPSTTRSQPMNQIAAASARREHRARPRRDQQEAPVRAVGALFEAHSRHRARRSSSAACSRARSWGRPASARASPFRTGGSRDSRGAGAFVRLAAADRRSTRRTASRSAGVRAAGARAGDRAAPAAPVRARADVQRARASASGSRRPPMPRELHAVRATGSRRGACDEPDRERRHDATGQRRSGCTTTTGTALGHGLAGRAARAATGC